MLNKTIKAYSLENALKFNGKASVGAVLGKVLQNFPEWKTKTKELISIITPILNEINNLSKELQEKELKELSHLLKKKEIKKEGLKELEGAEKGVIMRFAPSPSGPMHIGHANTGGITSLYCKKYNGKFILRIEDTNANNIYTPAYKLLKEDGDWLFGNVSEVWIQSDRMEIYYKYIEQFLEKGHIYVCTCTQEEFKSHSLNKTECPCRSKTDQKERLAKMKDPFGYKEGEAVLRFKTDMTNKNPAMRDFPLGRIIETPHPRQGKKYRLWPLMNLSVFVDDVEAKMTHIIRGKDHVDNAKRQELMYKALGITPPRTYFQGRINFEGIELSASKTRKKIEEGIYNGWEDIRLPFMRALKKRGYQPGAFLKYAEQIGYSPVDKSVKAEEFFKTINAFNKEIIDSKSRRYYIIKEPIEIKIEGSTPKEIELDLHPDNKKGGRKLNYKGTVLIEKEDYDKIKEGEEIRLISCLNFIKEANSFKFSSLTKEEFKGKKAIHWVPKEEAQEVKLRTPDNKIHNCKGEKQIAEIKIGEIVQFERIGFARLDKSREFWYAHK